MWAFIFTQIAKGAYRGAIAKNETPFWQKPTKKQLIALAILSSPMIFLCAAWGVLSIKEALFPTLKCSAYSRDCVVYLRKKYNKDCKTIDDTSEFCYQKIKRHLRY